MTDGIVAAADGSSGGAWVHERIRVGRFDVEVSRPGAPEDLIDEDEYAVDERLPYWAELWPSARVLAAALVDERLRSLRVIELGCGVGLPAIVAALSGAEVTATDWYEAAIQATRTNAKCSGTELRTCLLDWRNPPADLLAVPFDLVIAADVCYEARNADALATLLPQLVAKRGTFLMADPRRPDTVTLIDALEKMGWTATLAEWPAIGRPDESGSVIHLHRVNPPR